jgi:hypothetical protein
MDRSPRATALLWQRIRRVVSSGVLTKAASIYKQLLEVGGEGLFCGVGGVGW